MRHIELPVFLIEHLILNWKKTHLSFLLSLSLFKIFLPPSQFQFKSHSLNPAFPECVLFSTNPDVFGVEIKTGLALNDS